MHPNTFNVRFILKTEKTNKKGLAPIFARIRINGKKTEITTNRSIDKDSWLSKYESAFPLNKANKELNKYLEIYKGKIYYSYSSLLSSGEEIDVERFKLIFFGKPSQKKYYLIETTKEHNIEFEKLIGTKISYGSYKNYKTTLKYLIEFIPILYGAEDILLIQADYKFCESYFSFLTTTKKCKTNGANKQIQRLKKIINYATRAGYIQSNPMASYSLQFKPANRIALTMGELSKLMETDFNRDTLKIVRDIFIFQCYTGLSYSDVKRLKEIHIQKGIHNELWIKMERQKTEIAFSIPLLQIASDLLNKYADKFDYDGEFLLPVLSNQKMNDNLKIIQEIAGISKNLTTHLARHTFATTITLANGVPIETVSRMLGHTTLRTTQIYAKVLDGKISFDMDKLKEKLE